jgi:hypothetical protein
VPSTISMAKAEVARVRTSNIPTSFFINPP